MRITLGIIKKYSHLASVCSSQFSVMTSGPEAYLPSPRLPTSLGLEKKKNNKPGHSTASLVSKVLFLSQVWEYILASLQRYQMRKDILHRWASLSVLGEEKIYHLKKHLKQNTSECKTFYLYHDSMILAWWHLAQKCMEW